MNTFGDMFRVTVFGESHGKAVGAVIDGCPANLPLTEEDIQKELDRRKPKSIFSTPRREEDKVEILSGIFENKTTGAPICGIVYNKNIRPKDYEEIKYKPRPGHADLVYRLKYKNYDYRGGGRASGRVTVGHVIGGAVAKKLLSYTYNIKIIGYTVKIGKIESEFNYYNNQEIFNNESAVEELINKIENNPLRCPSINEKEMEEYILKAIEEKDSVGGVVEIVILNLPVGVGNPIFNKLHAELGRALLSINAVKGVEVGRGFKSSEMFGSEMNDEMYFDDEKNIKFYSNNSGGVLGGISTGQPVVLRIAIKPTPSIGKRQRTINLKTLENDYIEIKGRHDPIIVPRVIPVAEAMVAITLADLMIKSGFIHPCCL